MTPIKVSTGLQTHISSFSVIFQQIASHAVRTLKSTDGSRPKTGKNASQGRLTIGTEIICHPKVSDFEIYRSHIGLLGEHIFNICPQNFRR